MTDESKPTHPPMHPPTHPEGGGTDERRGAAESEADEVVREARHKYREARAKADEIRERLYEAHRHIAACQRAYRRAIGLPEEMKDETDILLELMNEVVAQREAAAKRAAEETMTDESKPTHPPMHPPTHPEGGGTDERRGAAESEADEVQSEALDKYHEAVSSAHELQQRLDEAFAHLQDCHRAYLRASGVPEERIDKTDLMWELITEVDVQRAADQSKPTRTEGGTGKRRSAAERKADEVLSEARRKYREALAQVAELRERRAETYKHVDACRKAYRRAWGFSEKMMDETDLMAALIEEVDAQREADARREAEEAKKNESESKTGK